LSDLSQTINQNEKKTPWQERIRGMKKVADFKHLFIYYKGDMYT